MVLPAHLIYMLSFACALVVSLVSIPQIIYIAEKKHLFDHPDNDRKLHTRIVPNLGGVAIFFAYIIITSLFIEPSIFGAWNYITASSIILFLTGIKDDLVSVGPSKKFFAQFIAAAVTVCLADIRLTSLHGILGIYDLPYWYSIAFTTVGIIFVTNAFNLIDGIDGLAGSIGVLCTFILGVCLGMLQNSGAAILAFSLTGGILGFLRFNIAPARIFMGDTGSLLLGFTISVLCIIFINSYQTNTLFSNYIHSSRGALVIGLSVLFVPVFDSFRVFITRMFKGGSPFKADRTHLHHYLMDLGFTHSRTVTILITANILIVTLSLLVQDYNPTLAILCIIAFTFGLFGILYFMRKRRLDTIRSLSPKKKRNTNGYRINGEAKDVKRAQVVINGKNIDEAIRAVIDK